MFQSTNILFKGHGLVWKKKFWTMTRKYRARELKLRLEKTEDNLRKPYVSLEPVQNQTLSQQDMFKVINGGKKSYGDIVDNYFNSLKNV